MREICRLGCYRYGHICTYAFIIVTNIYSLIIVKMQMFPSRDGELDKSM